MSLDDLQVSTELEAVNVLLDTIDAAPVNELDDSNVDVLRARNKLTYVSKEIQVKGWSFNSETDHPLSPNVDGEIVLNKAMIAVDIKPWKDALDFEVVVRGSKLYNSAKRTYQFDDAIEADVVWFLPWDELPEHARQYITIRAARKFRDVSAGDSVGYRFTREDERDARVAFKKRENKQQDRTYLSVRRTRFAGLRHPGWGWRGR